MSVFVLTTLIAYIVFALGNSKNLVSNNNMIITDKAKIRDTQTLFFIIGIVFFAFITGQRYYFGDTITYMDSFTEYTKTPGEVLSNFQFGKEDLYNFLVAFVKKYISTDPRIFIEIVSFCTILPIFYFLFNYSGDLKFAFLLFVLSGCWEHSMNGLRQYLAGSLLMLFFKCIYNRKWYIYLPVVVISAQIHTSAYIFLLIYFIANKPAWGKTTKVILFFGIALLITYPISGKFISTLLEETTSYGEKYSNNGFDYSINIFRILVMTVPTVIAFINRHSIKNQYKYYDIVFNMSLLCFVTTVLGLVSVAYARLNLYFEVFNVMLLVWNINDMVKRERYKWIKYACIVCFVAYFIYQMVFTYNLSWYERYMFFCNDWGDASWI